MYDYVKIFSGYYEAIEDLSDEDQLKIYKAICKYGLYEEEPELSGVSKTIWKIIKPLIDANHKNSINGAKGGRPKKETTDKKPTKKPQAKKTNNSGKAVENMKKDLVELFTKPHFECFSEHEDKDLKAITKFILDNSDNKDISNDHDLMDKAYVAIRKHLIKTHNIYSLTYKSNGKREPDQTTKEIYKHMNVTREQIENSNDTQKEAEFYSSFWDNHKGKVVTVDGVELDCNYDEEMFFLKGTKKTHSMGNNYILEQLWKQIKG